MKFIEIPNLPTKLVKLALVDGRISNDIEGVLIKKGIDLIKIKPIKSLYNAISCHPDTSIHHLGNEKIIYAPGINESVLASLANYGFNLIRGNSSLSYSYPGNIQYNVARVGNFAIHNTKYTDRLLLEELEKAGVKVIHVKQGYAKCSVCVVNDKSIITADNGIAKVAYLNNIDVLLIEDDDNIGLPGLNRGFIGGSTGLISRNKLAITGNIFKLKSANKIIKFLKSKNIEIEMLSRHKIIDIGTIIPLFTL